MENFNEEIEEMIAAKDKEIEERNISSEGEGGDVEDEDEKKQEEDSTGEKETENENNRGDENKDFEEIDFEHNGSKYKVETQEQLLELLKNGLGKETERSTNAQKLIAQENVTEENLAIMIDAMNGDRNALKKIIENNKIDALDLMDSEEDSTYEAKTTLKEESSLDKIANVILRDEEWTKNYRETLEILPCSDFKERVTSDANALSFFSQQVKSGLAERIIPEATILSITNKIPFTDAYIQVGKRMEENKNDTEKKEEIAKKKKLMSGGKSSSSKTKGETDAWKMDDKEFDKLWE